MKRKNFKGYHKPDAVGLDKVKLNYSKIKQALTIIQTEFVSKKKTYIYIANNGRKIGSVELNLRKRNLMHLCGFKYENGARQFFQAINNNKLNWKKVWIKDDGSTFQKLAVIQKLNLLSGLDAEISIGRGNRAAILQYDNLLRSKEEILALAISYDDHGEGIPISLLNLNMKTKRKIGIPAFPVYAVITENVVTHKKQAKIRKNSPQKIRQLVESKLKDN